MTTEENTNLTTEATKAKKPRTAAVIPVTMPIITDPMTVITLTTNTNRQPFLKVILLIAGIRTTSNAINNATPRTETKAIYIRYFDDEGTLTPQPTPCGSKPAD